MAAVRLDHLRKEFAGGAVAVEDFSLDIADGEFMTFLGPSGCGKTTTLRMIAGLEAPTGGAISFGDRRVEDLPPGKRNVAMVFQSYALYPHMSVHDNLAYPLKKRGVPRLDRERRVKELARTLRIEDLLGRRPKQLSGGQQQRVALGRAMIRDPEVFLLDEPLSNLDATLRAYMRAELIELHQRIGKTMIYVTHDQVEAMTMSTRIAVLSRGRLQQVGAPDEVYRMPANRFVASFVGTPAMNFMEGEMVAEAGRLLFRGGGIAIALPETRARALERLPPRRKVAAGLRPEDVLVATGAQPAQIALVEPMGHESIVFLDVSGQTIVSRAASDIPLRARSQTTVTFRGDRLHLFDSESGERLAC
jgi:multiple sugar transport system ATP-binding protein